MDASALIDHRPWLARLREHAVRARDEEHAEAVHQLRVATRRLDVWLRLGGRRMLRDDLRWLRHEAAPLRDLDVLLDRKDLPPEFARWLASERTDARRRLRDALLAPRLSGLLAALSRLPRLEVEAAWELLPDLVATARARARSAAKGGSAGEAEHAFRRSVRRVRYAGEWLGLPAGRLANVQERLGVASDLIALERWIARCPAPLAPRTLAAGLAEELAHTRAGVSRAVVSALEAMVVITRGEAPWSSS